ncbi:uncharacterized protein TNCV_1221351 [Trichonephila clavipes]|nr:uncharacterized protein TNCV_1221351 [Trichonephila clavipes]
MKRSFRLNKKFHWKMKISSSYWVENCELNLLINIEISEYSQATKRYWTIRDYLKIRYSGNGRATMEKRIAGLEVSDRGLPCHEFEPSTSKDPPCRAVMHVKSVEELKHPAVGVVWYDEAHFWLNGYVNKQNCRIWSEANPQVYVETPLHPEKLTGALYGLVESFFKNDEGHNVTVNGDRYRAMITNFFIPELNNHDVQELWFQQDGATCHTACATIDLLKDSLVYADKPQTLDHLEDNIRRVIADIRPQMLKKVIETWTSRLDYIRASHGSHARNHI